MCDLNAFVIRTGKEELVLESVDTVKIEGDKITLRSLFGEEKTLVGQIKEIQGLKRKIILEEK
jgi:predicted RNA-binding protein